MAEQKTNPLQFADLRAVTQYLVGLSLNNPAEIEARVGPLLDVLIAKPLPPRDMYAALEQIRRYAHIALEGNASRYQNKPLPLAAEEEAVFQGNIDFCTRLVAAYHRCLSEEFDVGLPETARFVAACLHRCLYYTTKMAFEHYRARRELPKGFWLRLHAFFARAEGLGLAATPVENIQENSIQSTHCTAAYVTALLIDIASPYSNSVRDISMMRRWADMWATLVTVQPLLDDDEVPPYLVELGKDQPLHQALSDHLGEDARCLDTTRLGLQINHYLSQLNQRITPAQLGLGEETAGHVIGLLSRLSRPWTQASSPRRFRRFPSAGNARVAMSFAAMHYHISGAPFVQPEVAKTYSRQEFDAIYTFRERVDTGQPDAVSHQAGNHFPSDEWQVINHSANGFRLTRTCVGYKIQHAQLMAVKPPDGDCFLLCRTSWLMQELSGEMMAGLSVLPGVPQAIGIRLQGLREPFVQAFMMPAVPVIKEEGSLVLPLGVYVARQVVEIAQGDQITQLRLLRVIERGADYERVSYEALQAG